MASYDQTIFLLVAMVSSPLVFNRLKPPQRVWDEYLRPSKAHGRIEIRLGWVTVSKP
jgi:hypothetical protein